MPKTLPVSASPVTAAAPPPPPHATPPRPTRAARHRARHGADGAGDGRGAAASHANRPEDRLSIRLLQAVDVCFARIYHRVNVLSPQRLPKQGPAILICNH